MVVDSPVNSLAKAACNGFFSAGVAATVGRSPVFQRKYRGSVLNFGQWLLPYFSSKCAGHLVSASVAESEPK